MGLNPLYKATTPYTAAQAQEMDFTQSADVLYVAHLDVQPYKCIRYSHISWVWTPITFGPTINPPVGISATVVKPNTTGYQGQTYRYVVTAIRDVSPVQESRASAIVTASNDLTLNGNYNKITVPAPHDDIARHVIYKEQGGVYGYIGFTETTSFEDHQLQPILATTPPKGQNPFTGADDYPSAVTLHQQRLMFGASRNVINGVWGSRSADPENMDRSSPARADDSLSFALVADKVNAITYLVSFEDLFTFTTDSIFNIKGGQTGVLSPGDILPKRSSSRGARRVKPVVVDAVTFFVPSRGSALRTMNFSFEIDGYRSNNVAIFSPHLFENRGVAKIAYQEEPFSCVWARMSDGTLLCFTWEAEQDVWGWSEIEIDGFVQDIAIIPESGYDRLYIVVKRTLGGVERVFYERMALPAIEIEKAIHLDCSITQTFDTPVTKVSGLWHLEGQLVSAAFDGFAEHNLLVEKGSITLPAAASTVTVGLPYTGRLETLPAALTSGQGSAHVNRQQIGDIIVRALDTRGIQIGANGAPMEQPAPKSGGDLGTLEDVSEMDYRVTPAGDWKDTSTVIVEQNEPFPAHVVGVFYTLVGANS